MLYFEKGIISKEDMIKKNLKQNQMLRERGLLRIFLFLFTANFLFVMLYQVYSLF